MPPIMEKRHQRIKMTECIEIFSSVNRDFTIVIFFHKSRIQSEKLPDVGKDESHDMESFHQFFVAGGVKIVFERGL